MKKTKSSRKFIWKITMSMTAVASSSGHPSFPGVQSPIPIPVPLPATGVADLDVALSPLGSSESDKENSRPGSIESTQPIVSELVEIQEVDE